MIRKTIATAAIAGAIVMAPTAALAAGTYPAPEDSLTCNKTVTVISTTVDCTIAGPNGAAAQLQTTFAGEDATIAGTVTSAPKTIAANVADFTITAPGVVGTIGVTGIIDGVAVDTAAVEVVTEVGGSGTDNGGLASTGFENAGLAIGAGALLVVGATTVFVAARRRQMQDA